MNRIFEPAIIFKKIEANGLKKGGNKHPPRPLHHIWSKLRTFKGYSLQKITRNQLQVRLKVVSAKNSLKTSKEGTFFSIFFGKKKLKTQIQHFPSMGQAYLSRRKIWSRLGEYEI